MALFCPFLYLLLIPFCCDFVVIQYFLYTLDLSEIAHLFHVIIICLCIKDFWRKQLGVAFHYFHQSCSHRDQFFLNLLAQSKFFCWPFFAVVWLDLLPKDFELKFNARYNKSAILFLIFVQVFFYWCKFCIIGPFFFFCNLIFQIASVYETENWLF